MSSKITHPRPTYELKDYSSNSDCPVRFCSFRYEQDIQTMSIILDDLISIKQHPSNKLKATVTSRSLHFTIEDYGLSSVHLILSKLAHHVIPSQSRITVKDDKTIVIMLRKVKPQIWKSVIYVSILVKNFWIKSIKGFLYAYFKGRSQEDEVKDIWGRVEGLYTDDINFYLNPPKPFGPLNVLKNVKTVEEVIKSVKQYTISRRGDKKVDRTMPYFLGAAILFDLIESFPAMEPVEECNVSLESISLRGGCIVEPLASPNLREGRSEQIIRKDKNVGESRKQIMKSIDIADYGNQNSLLSCGERKSERNEEEAIFKLKDVCYKFLNNPKHNSENQIENKIPKSPLISNRKNFKDSEKNNKDSEYLLNTPNNDRRVNHFHNQNSITNTQEGFQSSCNVLNDKGSFFNNEIQKGNSKSTLRNKNKKIIKNDMPQKGNRAPVLTHKNNKNNEKHIPNFHKVRNGRATKLGNCNEKENIPKKQNIVSNAESSSNNAEAILEDKTSWENAEESKSQGNEFFKAENYSKARDCYAIAIELNQDNPVYYINRAACFIKLEQYQECWDDACKAYNLEPSSKAYYYMGKSALHIGWICRGVSYLSMAARLDSVSMEDVLKELQIGHHLKEKVMEYIMSMQEGNFKRSKELLNDIDKFCKIGVTELQDRMYTDFLQGGESMKIKFLATADLASNAKDLRAIYYLAKSNFHLNLKEEALTTLSQCDLKCTEDSYLFRVEKLKRDIGSFYFFKEKGDKAYIKNDFKEAEDWYLLSVEIDSLNKSENAKLYCKLGDIKMAEGDYEDAVRYFTLSRNQDSTLLEPRMKKIECYENMGQYYNATKEAIGISELTGSEEEHSIFHDQLEYGLKKCKFETNHNVKQGDKHHSTGEYALAIECYTKAILSEADCAPWFIRRSLSYLAIDQFQLAFMDATNAEKLEPKNTDACLHLGKCCKVIGRNFKAQSVLKRATEIDPTRIDVLYELRKVQRLSCLISISDEEIKNKNFEVASSILKDAVSIARGCYYLQLQRAECLILINNWDEIESIVNFLRAGIDECPEYECILGMRCYYEGNLEESIIHFKKALKVKPEHLKSEELKSKSERFLKIKHEGDVASSKQNFETALSLYKSGLKVDPQNSFVNSLLYYNVGLVFIEKKNISNAIDALSSAIATRSHFLAAYLKKAECNLLLGKKDHAIDDYKIVCKLFPNEEHDKLLQSVLNDDEDNLETS